MASTHELPTPPGDSDPAPLGELVVMNGRLSGARRALTGALTLIGRSEGCEIRLNVEGVNGLHCALVHGREGLLIHDLQSDSGTLVNGQPVTTRYLDDGDVLTIGPFRFRLRLPPQAYAIAGDEQEALRIQAAAVAAQQAALTEEEMRLQQRRQALEQQEEQLAAHLEEKRQRLLTLRDEARKEQTALKAERTTYEQRVAEATRRLAAGRREVAEGERQNRLERQRLLDLRRRMKRRWHRQWAAERAVIRLREGELEDERRRLEREAEQVRQERAAVVQARLCHNGDIEIGKRQLQARWDEFYHEQARWEEQREREESEWQQRRDALGQREAAVAEAERLLAQERRRWEERCQGLEQEAEGLENRVRNYRRKLLDQEQEAARLDAVVHALEQRVATAPSPSLVPVPGATPLLPPSVPATLPAALLEARAELDQREALVAETENEIQERVAALERLAGELADQRLYLAEQAERLARAQQQWEQERGATAAELETVRSQLHEQAEALALREQSLADAEAGLRQRLEAAATTRNHLEAWQARLTASAAAWAGERERIITELRGREELLERRQTALTAVRHRWEERRRRLIARLRQERTACEELRQEWAALREDYWRRSANLEAERRSLAERTLALEQYRQECLGQAANPKAAERRLERLRRRWAALAVTAERNLTRERLTLEKQATRVEEQARWLQKQADDLGQRDAELESRQTAWEHQELLVRSEQERTQYDLQNLLRQRECYEQQLADLHEEVERLARLLIGDDETAPPLGRAA